MSDVYGNSGQPSAQPPQSHWGSQMPPPDHPEALAVPAGQMPAAATGTQTAATPSSASVAETPGDVARAILMNPDFSPHDMSNRFWEFRQEYLKQTYGIDIK